MHLLTAWLVLNEEKGGGRGRGRFRRRAAREEGRKEGRKKERFPGFHLSRALIPFS